MALFKPKVPFFNRKIENMIDLDEAEKKHLKQEKAELEKGDLLAIVIAAARVFIPVLLAFIAVIWGLSALFLHVY